MELKLRDMKLDISTYATLEPKHQAARCTGGMHANPHALCFYFYLAREGVHEYIVSNGRRISE
jgi:hypothetical protein